MNYERVLVDGAILSECGCWPLPGVVAPMDTDDGIQRCDECAGTDVSDLDAAARLAEHVGGDVWFYTATDDPSRCEDCHGQPAECEWPEHIAAVKWTGPNDQRLIASGTNPWVEVNGEVVSWAMPNTDEED